MASPGTCNWAKALTLPWRLEAVQTYVPASWGRTEGSSSMWFSRRLSGGRFPSTCRRAGTVTPGAACTSVGPAPHPPPGAPTLRPGAQTPCQAWGSWGQRHREDLAPATQARPAAPCPAVTLLQVISGAG